MSTFRANVTPPPDLTPFISKAGGQHYAGGAFGDVYKCCYTDDLVQKKVAVKAIRFRITIDGDTDGKYAKMLRRELGIWKRLVHINVVPFLGIAYGFGMEGTMSLVSLWMPNESLHTFLAKNDGMLGVVHRLQFLLDIANGLHYLHSIPIVHGDLNCSNVLLDADYTVRLADFGFASLVGNIPEALSYLQRSTTRAGALRWCAPEQIESEGTYDRTTKSDIYSFGCVSLQVLSGKQPWSECKGEGAVALRLARGQKPGRPESRMMDDSHWNFILYCWSPMDDRPTTKPLCDLLASQPSSGGPVADSSQPVQVHSGCENVGESHATLHATPEVEIMQDRLTINSSDETEEEYYELDSSRPSSTVSLSPDTLALPLPPDQEDELALFCSNKIDHDDGGPDPSKSPFMDGLILDVPRCIIPATPTTPNQPIAMTKRVHALRKLLSSERTYASDLALIRDIHIPLALGQPTPFNTSGFDSQTVSSDSDSSATSSQLGPPMTWDDVRVIFGNIIDLAMFSDRFVNRLEEALGSALDGGSGEDRVGALFLELIPSLEPSYKKYITRHPTGLAQFNALPSSPALSAYLSHTRTLASSLTHAWDLPSLLVKPTQQLLNYSPLLGAIIDVTADSHGDRSALVKARERIEEIARSINEDRRRREVIHEILKGAPIPTVKVTGKSKKGNGAVNVGMGAAASMHLNRMKSLRGPKPKDVVGNATDNAEAAEVARLEGELQRYAVFLDKLAKDVKDWRLSMRHALVTLWQWGVTFGAMLGLSPSPSVLLDTSGSVEESDSEGHSEAYDTFALLLASLPGLCMDLEQGLQKSFIPLLSNLKRMMEPPTKLLNAMHSLQSLHVALLHTPFSQSKSRRPLLTASQSYLALRSALSAELPILLRAMNKATGLAVRIVAKQQAAFYTSVGERWAELWDALRVEGERCGGVEETLRVWWERWSEVEVGLSMIKMTRKDKSWAEKEKELRGQAVRAEKDTEGGRGDGKEHRPMSRWTARSAAAQGAPSKARPSPTLTTTRALYTTRAIHPCLPPAGVSYRGLPFFQLICGDLFEVLREYGHPSTHADLPLFVDDDGEDCLLLVRARSKGGEYELGDVGWALASFLLPVD